MTGKKFLKGMLAAGTALLFAALLCTCSGLPKAGPAAFGNLGRPSDPAPFMENVRTGTLPNGMKYFILENSKPENRAYLTLAVNTGSMLEEDDEQGLAHFVEHMTFKGTERFPEAELVNYLRSLGMRFGPEVNAYTSFEATAYPIEVPVETGEDGTRRIPDTALAVIDDWSRAVTFDPEAVAGERPVIMEEYRMRLGVGDRLQRQWVPVLLRGSRYAERYNVIGLPEIIEGAPASRLKGFYQKWYRADNMALIFVGDFDGAALEASLKDHFLIEKPDTPTVRPVYDLPPPKKGNLETLILTDPEMTGTLIDLYFKRTGEPVRGDLAYYRSGIIDSLISRMLNLRFTDAAEKPETPYAGADAGHERYGQSSRFYELMAVAKTGMVEETLEELLRIKESMIRYGFTDAELTIAKDALVSYFRQQAQEKDRQESSGYERMLRGYYLGGEKGYLTDWEWDVEAMEQLLPRIGIKEINAVVKNYFDPHDLQVFIFAPEAEAESLPSEARVRKMVADSRKMKIERPKSDAVEDRLLFDTPQRGQVVSQATDDETGAVIWELGNGARVILKTTENKNDQIIMRAVARGGTSSGAAEDDVSNSLAVEMMQVSGLGPWSRPELARKLAAKQASFGQWIGSYYRGFSGGATTEDLKTLFEMLYLNFTDPRIEPEPVQAMMDTYETALARRDDNPDTVFSDEITRTVTGNHPRFKPTELDDLPKADTDTALAFIRRTLNPGDYTFVFAGNLDAGVMRDYVETYIASIPQGESWNEWTDLDVTRPGKVEKNVHKGREEKSSVYMAWYAKAPYTVELDAAADVLEEYLDIRLDEEIREKLGGVYSIGSSVSAGSVPRGELSMSVIFGCDPGRVEELSAAVISLLNSIAGPANAGGVDRDVFNKAVEACKKSWETSMQSNSYIAGNYANLAVLQNAPLSRLEKWPQYYGAVTPADLQRICTQLLQSDSNGPARVVLLPENR